jgi:hypothetical protein
MLAVERFRAVPEGEYCRSPLLMSVACRKVQMEWYRDREYRSNNQWSQAKVDGVHVASRIQKRPPSEDRVFYGLMSAEETEGISQWHVVILPSRCLGWWSSVEFLDAWTYVMWTVPYRCAGTYTYRARRKGH